MSVAVARTPELATAAPRAEAARPRFAVRWGEVGLMFAAWTMF